MIPKKAIIFDLDQTILDRTTSLIKFLNWQINFFQLVSTMKKEFFIQRFLELDDNGKIWKDSVYEQLIHEFSIDHVTYDRLLSSYINDFNKFSCCFKNVESTIIELREQGYLIGLISNGRTSFQEHNFYALGLTTFFSSIIISEAVGIRKPDPEIFLLCCKELDVCPKNCIFVGDNEVADIQGAKAVGMKTIFFHPDPSITSLIADATLHYYTNLIDLLKTI